MEVTNNLRCKLTGKRLKIEWSIYARQPFRYETGAGVWLIVPIDCADEWEAKYTRPETRLDRALDGSDE